MSAPPLLRRFRLSRLLRLLFVFTFLLSMIPAALATPMSVQAQSETPRTIATARVDSYALPSPGLFYYQAAVCPAGPGPSAASSVPDVVESPMRLWRNTVRNEDERALQVVDDIGGPAVCNPYTLYSNIVADTDFVYWVDANGLVKLPVTANVGDTPTKIQWGDRDKNRDKNRAKNYNGKVG